jgi:hypothetical protein
MADQHNANIPAMGNQILSDIPDIKENLEWHKDVLSMVLGWKDSTIATVGPPNHRSDFAYSSTTAISIGTGSYFHDGTTRQTVFWDTAITFTLGSGGSNSDSDDLGASEWHYIYLDDSAIVTQASPELDADCFSNDTTAPTWSAAKHGWYSGSDRCIFAVITNASSQIIKWYHAGDYVQFDVNPQPVTTNTTQPATWTDMSALTMPGFARKGRVTFTMKYVDSANSFMFWRTNGSSSDGYDTNVIGIVSSDATRSTTVTDVITDSSALIEVKGVADNAYTCYQNGWYLPNGF